jgi:hypothetical protein
MVKNLDMSRWPFFMLAFALTGCFNGLLIKPFSMDGPVSETGANLDLPICS